MELMNKLNDAVTAAMQMKNEFELKVKENQELQRVLDQKLHECKQYQEKLDQFEKKLTATEADLVKKEREIGICSQILATQESTKVEQDRVRTWIGKEEDRLKKIEEGLIEREDQLLNRVKAVSQREADVTEREKEYKERIKLEFVDKMTGGSK